MEVGPSWTTHLLDTPLRHLGSGGLSVANQIYNRFLAADKPLSHGDIVVLDTAQFHHYQVRCMEVYFVVRAHHFTSHFPLSRVGKLIPLPIVIYPSLFQGPLLGQASARSTSLDAP